MKFKQGKYIVADGHVYLKIVIALSGDYDCYGTTNVKHPVDVKWYTEQELDRLGFKEQEPDLNLFDSIRVGDTIKTGDTYRQILARVEDAVLVSMSKDKNAKMLLSMADEVEKVTEQEMLSEGQKRELRDRTSPIKTRSMAEDWWDIKTLALMNWIPVSEVIEEEVEKSSLERQLDELGGK